MLSVIYAEYWKQTHYADFLYAKGCLLNVIMLITVMLGVTMLFVIVLNVVMLNVIILSVIMMIVIMLNVVMLISCYDIF